MFRIFSCFFMACVLCLDPKYASMLSLGLLILPFLHWASEKYKIVIFFYHLFCTRITLLVECCPTDISHKMPS